MTSDNLLLVHWHDLGRHLNAYGAPGVVSPHTDRLASESIVFERAHATAPLCSPSRGSLMTGRYPHDNGLIGLAHHGFAYRDDVRTLPQILAPAGWRTVLYGMQHESSHPSRLGYDEYDVTSSYCDDVVALATRFLDRGAPEPFLLNAGFFETHRPFPASEYRYADPAGITVPEHLPDTAGVREDYAAFHGSIAKADAAVGRLLGALERTGLDTSTWVVFFTDHGAAFPRAKSTLYDAGTGIALMIRPPRRRGYAPRRVPGLFSGVDLVPTLLDLLGQPVPDEVQGVSHAPQVRGDSDVPARDAVFTQKTYHDAFDPIRAVRTEHFSYIENLAPRPALVLPLDIEDSLSGAAVAGAFTAARPPVELYDLETDPGERVNLADDPRYQAARQRLARTLHTFRQEAGDQVPSDAEGTTVAARNLAAYLTERARGTTPVPRSPRGADRRYDDPVAT